MLSAMLLKADTQSNNQGRAKCLQIKVVPLVVISLGAIRC
jgi:hypothetical protein